jgi:hypothetical protein
MHTKRVILLGLALIYGFPYFIMSVFASVCIAWRFSIYNVKRIWSCIGIAFAVSISSTLNILKY